MRHKHKREWYIPKNAKLLDSFGTDAAVYVWDEPQNRNPFCAMGFHGKAQKPDFNYIFKKEESRAKYIADYLAGRKATTDYRTKIKAERLAWKPNYKIGEILHTCWGYDQTNVEFFEVVEVRGKHVVLREVAQKRTETGFMTGDCVPLVGSYIGEPIRRLAQQHGIKISSVRYAHRGHTMTVAGIEVHKPHRWSSYA